MDALPVETDIQIILGQRVYDPLGEVNVFVYIGDEDVRHG
jgi:hypothetical protein